MSWLYQAGNLALIAELQIVIYKESMEHAILY